MAEDISAPSSPIWTTHDLELRADVGAPLRIREVDREAPLAAATFQGGDHSGAFIWPASLAMARWIGLEAALTQGQVVYELGSGCGLAGLAAATAGLASEVHLTEKASGLVLDNLRHNVELNAGRTAGASVRVETVDWCVPATWPDARCADVVLGTDLVYDDGRAQILGAILSHLLKPGGLFVHLHPVEGRMGVCDLRESLASVGLAMVDERELPPSLHRRGRLDKGGALSSAWYLDNAIASSPFVMQRYCRLAPVAPDGADVTPSPAAEPA